MVLDIISLLLGIAAGSSRWKFDRIMIRGRKTRHNGPLVAFAFGWRLAGGSQAVLRGGSQVVCKRLARGLTKVERHLPGRGWGTGVEPKRRNVKGHS